MSAPIPLVPVDPSLLSSYDRAGHTGGPRASCTPLASLGHAGIAAADMARALLALANAVAAAGGDFRVTECHRDIAVQRAARARYDAWAAAGKPKPLVDGKSNPLFVPSRMKAAYVATPGRSGHNAGRSIDVHLGVLRFPGIPADQWLDRLWALATPLGWTPIIKSADESASEAWHFDYWGELTGVKQRLGYEQAALCGAILAGHGDLEGYAASIQALLSRAGFDLGPIDGKAGTKTRSALGAALGLSEAEAARALTDEDPRIVSRLVALPAK